MVNLHLQKGLLANNMQTMQKKRKKKKKKKKNRPSMVLENILKFRRSEARDSYIKKKEFL